MHKLPLKDVCKIQYGYPFDSKLFNANNIGKPLVRIRDVVRGYTETYTSETCADGYVVTRGDILIGMDGEFNIAKWRSDSAFLNQRVCKITPQGDIDEDYLLYYLLQALKAVEDKTSYVTVKHLSAKVLESIEIPLIGLQEQKEITTKLNRLSSLIDKRKQQLENLDKLIKSQFIEMFGDPASNPYGWDVVAIGDVVTEVRYGTSNPAVEGGQYPYLRMNNITYDGHLDLSDMKYIDISDDEIEKYIVRKGDVLFNRTNSVELVGKTCLFELDDPMVIAGYIIRIRLNNRLLPVVLSNYLNSNRIKDRLRSIAKGAVNQANINAKELQSIKVYLPPIDRQNKFSRFVEQTNKSKFTIKQSLEQLEILKKSLMQKYFG